MNKFVIPVAKIEDEFYHEKPALFLEGRLLLEEIHNFIEDSKKEDEQDCAGWGVEEFVFPLSSWDKFFEFMRNDREFKKAQQRGLVHVVNIQERKDGGNIDSVVLSMGYMNLNQKIVFYDLPESNKLAA